ncbi:MAG TPA: prolyl oligopeptidase family serine peptidase [Blastocatellia bacterium]|nr:prolyl oligopeptidase family serine peptidase [Blastocatellia bacterium]
MVIVLTVVLTKVVIVLSKLARRTALAASVVLAFAALAGAQTATQALRLSVGFNTLKNSKPLESKASAEVDGLARDALAAASSGKYDVAIKDYYHGIAILRGEAWTPSRALASALTFKLDHAMLEPSQTVTVETGEVFSPDDGLAGPVTATITLRNRQGEQVAVLATIPGVKLDLKAHPLVSRIQVPDVPANTYHVRVTFSPAQGDQASKDAEVRIEKGLRADVTALRSRINTAYSRLTSANTPNLTAALHSVEYHLALYDLANSQQIDLGQIDFDGELKQAANELTAVESGSDPYSSRRGDFRRAYLSAVDKSIQPYRIYVPASYDGSKPYPLIIALHGMGGDENSYFDLYGNGAFKTLAGQHGYIVACPKGRDTASMYRGDAEQDVMDVLADVERNYKTDRDRIYLTGHSMGGFGTWSVAMDYPDVFAAIAPISGGGNPALLSRITRVPELVVHGDADKTVPVQRSRAMVAAGKKLGIEIKYIEVPGGSHVGVPVPAFKDVFEFFDSHRRRTEN